MMTTLARQSRRVQTATHSRCRSYHPYLSARRHRVVCHAMIMANTNGVLPVPAAIVSATPGSPSSCNWFSGSRRCR
jgi:hypothetical protein